MDCLLQDSGEKDQACLWVGRTATRKSQQGGNHQWQRWTRAEKAPLGKQGKALDRRAELGALGLLSFQQVPALAGAHQLPVLHGAGKSPCCSNAASVSLLYEAKLTLLL